MPNFYITTTLPYLNAEPHLGFALEIVRADCLARWHHLAGDAVFFNTGTDEHGLKIARAAAEVGLAPQIYCDQLAQKFADLKPLLNLSYDNFIRTTDNHHLIAAQEFWRRCLAAGDIYQKSYQVKYCVGCELEKTDSELVDEHCPIHPNLALELIDEENYFFRFSRYQDQLLKLYDDQANLVQPPHRLKEVRNFVAGGLTDFSISRLASKMPWGVSVPDDDTQVMYVWFDALVNYISALGWPEDEINFAKWWQGATQVAGKDNLRQQAAIWQAMLLSAGLPPTGQIFINGFITADGQKMSKSLGNVIKPVALAKQYGGKAVRYYLLAEIQPFEDSDFTESKFRICYQANLANGLGNLVSRVTTLLAKYEVATTQFNLHGLADFNLAVGIKLKNYLFNEALEIIWQELRALDQDLTTAEPWKLSAAKAVQVLQPLTQRLLNVAVALRPFLPATAEKILACFAEATVVKSQSLFPRLD